MPQGDIRWIEIPAPNGDELAAFYEKAFGWKILRDQSFPGYTMFMEPGDQVGGGFSSELKPSTTGPAIYITVDDIETSLQAVKEAGGTVVTGKTQIAPEVGWWANFDDPAGNRMAIYESAQK